MDSGSGWLVSQSGLWVPVAYNASVSKGLAWQRSSFTSLDGIRRTVSRGRTPRTWEVEETVVAEWAQPLESLWESSESDSPMYWVPPISYLSNYAKKVYGPASTRPGLRVSDNEVGIALQPKLGAVQILTDFTPVKVGVELEYGARVDSLGVGIIFYDAQFNYLSTVSYGASTRGTDGFWAAQATPADGRVAYARVFTHENAAIVESPFIRKNASTYGIAKVGDGGTWVTLDELSIDHGASGLNHVLMKVSFSLTECELS